MIQKNINGALYNVVAPLHPTKREVIAAQNNLLLKDITYHDKERIISSEKLISELNFTFTYPDPVTFHLHQ